MRRNRRRRVGFTVLEVTLVSVLLALFIGIFSQAWRDFAMPAVEAQKRARLALEGCLAKQCLALDFSGCAPEAFDLSRSVDDVTGFVYRAYATTESDPTEQTGGTILHLVFYSSSNGLSSDQIVYRVVTDVDGTKRLERDQGTTKFTVARNLTRVSTEAPFNVTIKKPDPNYPGLTTVTLDLTFEKVSSLDTALRTYKFIGVFKP